jgi:hypothetical protein
MPRPSVTDASTMKNSIKVETKMLKWLDMNWR